MEPNHELLKISLSAAVPLWILKLKRMPWAQVIEQRERSAQMIAEHGDNILYRAKKKGETAAAFNALAEALAMLAFCPGGVTFAGLHFEAIHEGEHEA